MPATRGQNHAVIPFPVKKGGRATRSRVKVVQDENTPTGTSPRKRSAKKASTKEQVPPCSPPKRSRDKSTTVAITEGKENAGVRPLACMDSPIKALRIERIPLSPRKDLLNSPRQDLLNSPLALPLGSPLRANLSTPSKALYASPARVRVLTFGSPAKSPSLVRTPDRNTITKGRALTFNEPANENAEPKNSPGTPRPLKIKPILSPLRLARQEGLCYQRAKQALHTALPERLVCREKEMKEVAEFLENHVSRQVPGSLYISGAPGTGKTAVLSYTMKKLKEEASNPVVYINCMSMRNSQAVYNKILSQLKGRDFSLSSKQAMQELERCFCSHKKMIIMILDEIDQLDSKNQEILYTMFEWPSLPKSRLVLIGIANALDLTDRILPRLQARPKCRPKLMNFPPYSKDQIVKVLQDRLQQVEVNGAKVMDPSAIQFCARKVAAVAGDMRKALDVCRRAVEVVEADVRKQQVFQAAGGAASPTKAPGVPKKISVPHILKIVNEVYGARVAVQPGQQQNIPLQQKLAVCSLLLLRKHGKVKHTTVGKLHETYKKVCQRQNMAGVDQSEFVSMCGLVEARGILGIDRAKDARMAKVSLKMDEQELEATLQDKTLMSTILAQGLP